MVDTDILMRVEQRELRNAAICKERKDGMTLRAIARSHGLTAETIRGIVAQGDRKMAAKPEAGSIQDVLSFKARQLIKIQLGWTDGWTKADLTEAHLTKIAEHPSCGKLYLRELQEFISSPDEPVEQNEGEEDADHAALPRM